MSGEGWGGATRLGSEPLAGEPFGEWLDASGRRGWGATPARPGGMSRADERRTAADPRRGPC